VLLPGVNPGLMRLPLTPGNTWNAAQTWPAGPYLVPRPYAWQSRARPVLQFQRGRAHVALRRSAQRPALAALPAHCLRSKALCFKMVTRIWDTGVCPGSCQRVGFASPLVWRARTGRRRGGQQLHRRRHRAPADGPGADAAGTPHVVSLQGYVPGTLGGVGWPLASPQSGPLQALMGREGA